MSGESLARLRAWVRDERASELQVTDKACPPQWVGRSLASFSDDPGASTDLPTPCLTLSRRALNHNRAQFADWVAAYGVAHAPHGKTSMAPSLWLDQLEAGAWAITVANEFQLRVALAAGVPRVVVANLLLRPDGLRWLAQQVSETNVEVISWVDSLEAVGLIDQALGDSEPASGARLPVLVELGTVRTGARDVETALAVARAVADSDHLELVGVGGYEGVAVQGHSADDAAVVRDFLEQMASVAEQIRPLVRREQLILSAGGSTWFDLVAEVFGRSTPQTLVLVRSGAMVSHDDGVYRASTPAARGADGPDLVAALHLWARVIALPDPGRAILDAGKRDLPFDSGLPTPQLAVVDGEFVGLSDHELIGSNDQHATMRLPDGSPLRVGSVVRFGISHPCTAFDKWRTIPVLDDADRVDAQVVDWVRTWF